MGYTLTAEKETATGRVFEQELQSVRILELERTLISKLEQAMTKSLQKVDLKLDWISQCVQDGKEGKWANPAGRVARRVERLSTTAGRIETDIEPPSLFKQDGWGETPTSRLKAQSPTNGSSSNTGACLTCVQELHTTRSRTLEDLLKQEAASGPTPPPRPATDPSLGIPGTVAISTPEEEPSALWLRQTTPGSDASSVGLMLTPGDVQSAWGEKYQPRIKPRLMKSPGEGSEGISEVTEVTLGSANTQTTRRSSLTRAITMGLQGALPAIWNRIDGRSKRAEAIWNFFEEPDSSRAAMIYNRMVFLLILVGAFIPVLQTLPSPAFTPLAFFIMSSVTDLLFLVETCVRWSVSPSTTGFLVSFYNLLDIAILPPFVLRIALFHTRSEDTIADSILVCVVPLMRVIRALRHLSDFTLLFHTLSAVIEPLAVPLSMLAVMCVTFSSALYVLEPRDNISSMPHAMWLVFVTVSTVGYGDVYPTTDGGRVVVSLLILSGVLCMAMPISIVGAAFTETWRNRTRIVIVGRMRMRLRQWGYTEEDLRQMFKKFDTTGSGELDVDEFGKMVATMRLGLNESSVERLFNVFDADGSGALDADEFVEGIGLNRNNLTAIF